MLIAAFCLPTAAAILYTLLHIYKDLRMYTLLVVLGYGAVFAGAALLYGYRPDMGQSAVFACLLTESLSFFVLHLKKRKIALWYHGGFYLLLLCLAASAVKASGIAPMVPFMMTLSFFLAESNQNLMRKTYEESVNEYQNKIMKRQVDEVQNIYMTMRGWRHDFHNHIQTVKAHLALGQTGTASDYLSRLDTDLDKVNQLVESGNVNLDAILNSKLSFAQKNEIPVDYKAKVPASLAVSDIDLCVLIGNLIDNAVEACEKLEPDKRFMRLYIGVFKQQLYISVSNATGETVRKMDEEYITTKRGNHGHGLKRINNIVEKYQGYIKRENEPGVFATEIMLPL